MTDRERQQLEELQLTATMIAERRDETPRYRRALRFANEVMHLMRDFIPRDRDIQMRISDSLLRAGFQTNAEIISVPLECDELDKRALEQRRLELSMQPVRVAPILTVAEQAKDQ